MQLKTEIRPRADGTVRVIGVSGKAYVFEPDADGDLSAAVDDEADAALMLATGNFFPGSDEDASLALTLMQAERAAAAAAADVDAQIDEEAGMGGDDNDEDGDDDDLKADMSALPIEANTPPAPVNPERKKRQGR